MKKVILTFLFVIGISGLFAQGFTPLDLPGNSETHYVTYSPHLMDLDFRNKIVQFYTNEHDSYEDFMAGFYQSQVERIIADSVINNRWDHNYLQEPLIPICDELLNRGRTNRAQLAYQFNVMIISNDTHGILMFFWDRNYERQNSVPTFMRRYFFEYKSR